jgi:ubiquitin carboxyl-terminal hydrolase 34
MKSFQCHLGEGLALEAEKTLCNLICYTPDKEIRMKFIEGCLHNLANNVYVLFYVSHSSR